MGKLKDAILILGEGPTEYFYINSLKDEFPFLQNIEPKIPKHTNLTELERHIERAISDGYTKVFCLIDMDNKKEGAEKTKYDKLKNKFSEPIIDVKKGINCEVIFFETERCTELFFYYYFKYTTKKYNCSDDVVRDLHKECGYLKELKFFAKHPLHSHFIKHGGTLENAIVNSEKSCKSRSDSYRDYTYSQIGKMLNILFEMNAKHNK